MTTNTETPRAQSGGSQEVLFAAGGGTAATVQRTRPVLVVTSGRVEYAARCPKCGDWHRHVSLGEKTAPCGAVYELAPRRGRAA